MKRLLLLSIPILILIGCSETECARASCLAPPSGTFNRSEYNIAIYEVMTEGDERITIDSVSINGSLMVKDFYTWIAIENPDQVTTFTLYSGDTQYVANDMLADITGDLKGFIFGFVKNGDSIVIEGGEASEDLINGVCNDVIHC
ncbi:hypothetical protein [Ekhidna sp.]|uniref:hypothetical protein n=1 Tax=Ekhidna sp. TaxID=2608089 RepID=UPI003B50C8E2